MTTEREGNEHVKSNREKGSRVTLTAVALVLLLAAILKGYSLLVTPFRPEPWWESRYLQLTLVSGEFLFSLWLFTTPKLRRGNALATLVFACFAVFSAVKLWQGADSCGCWGQWKVSPLLTLILDSVCAVALWLTRLHSHEATELVSQPLQRTIAAMLSMVAVMIFVLLALRPIGGRFESGSLSVRSGELVILEPETWVGKMCPVLDYIETDTNLRSGKAFVVFIRHDCHTCEQKLASYQRLSRAGTTPLVLIEVPPFGQTIEKYVSGRLRKDINWLVQTPAELTLQDGMVVTASHKSEMQHDLQEYHAANGNWP